MNPYRWLLIMEESPDPAGPDQRYRLWLVALDEENPPVPLRCDSVDAIYQALMNRMQSGDDAQQACPLPDAVIYHPDPAGG